MMTKYFEKLGRKVYGEAQQKDSMLSVKPDALQCLCNNLNKEGDCTLFPYPVRCGVTKNEDCSLFVLAYAEKYLTV